MCGIAGWIDWEEDVAAAKPVVERMTERLAPRGPDAEGFWFSRRAGIGHRRLIVVDPEGGRQPMIRQLGGKTFILTYNGELYNTAEVRRELEARGHRFLSYSDTEVVLVAFIEWGENCVERFNGIFAFGIWEETTQTLFLARDRMGVKPLFFAQQGSALIFGSEIKALLAHPKLSAVIDREGLAEIFGLGPARTPGCGVFKGIQEIRPGCWALYDRAGLKIRRYWNLVSKPHGDSLEETTARVRELVTDAIQRQLVSDVPVCTFLSGGLDSSIISAVAAAESGVLGRGPLDTYSIDFFENDRYFTANDFQPNADAPWVSRVSQFLGTRHHPVILDTAPLATALHEAVLARDLPGMADVDSSLYLFCKEIKQGATVALSGECADEVFGGYPWFHRPEAFQADTFPWSLSLDFRNQILNPALLPKIKLQDYVADRYREALREVPDLPGEGPVEARRRELFYLNLHWFMAVLLDRKDRMSMASGLEVRVPFCDHRIVEYVWNIPWALKSYDNREKGILRRAVAGLLPQDVVYRKKSPYPKTHHPSYAQTTRRLLLDVLTSPREPIREIVNHGYIKELIESGKEIARPWFGQLMTGPQFFAYLLQVNDWLKEYRIEIRD